MISKTVDNQFTRREILFSLLSAPLLTSGCTKSSAPTLEKSTPPGIDKKATMTELLAEVREVLGARIISHSPEIGKFTCIVLLDAHSSANSREACRRIVNLHEMRSLSGVFLEGILGPGGFSQEDVKLYEQLDKIKGKPLKTLDMLKSSGGYPLLQASEKSLPIIGLERDKKIFLVSAVACWYEEQIGVLGSEIAECLDDKLETMEFLDEARGLVSAMARAQRFLQENSPLKSSVDLSSVFASVIDGSNLQWPIRGEVLEALANEINGLDFLTTDLSKTERNHLWIDQIQDWITTSSLEQGVFLAKVGAAHCALLKDQPETAKNTLQELLKAKDISYIVALPDYTERDIKAAQLRLTFP